jgi:hypothetical protein
MTIVELWDREDGYENISIEVEGKIYFVDNIMKIIILVL